MSQLQPVTLEFGGNEYTVDKDDGIWGLIEAIEDIVTLLWLAPRLHAKQVPAVKIYRAYAAALNYAGAKDVTIDELRAGVTPQRLMEMGYELAGILSMGMPPMDMPAKGASTKEIEAAKKKGSSGKTTKRG